jgi:hypothetical protein
MANARGLRQAFIIFSGRMPVLEFCRAWPLRGTPLAYSADSLSSDLLSGTNKIIFIRTFFLF